VSAAFTRSDRGRWQSWAFLASEWALFMSGVGYVLEGGTVLTV
jgi:hypothetical protein